MSAAGVDALIWTALMMAVALMAIMLLYAVRRRMRRTDESASPPFTLAELKRLRDAGEITIPEYDALRAKLLDKARSGKG
jgi:hypothetical protein